MEQVRAWQVSRDRLKAILDACAPLRVGVIGDLGLDAYWYADMTQAQLSREAPLYGRPVVRETYTPGGAANVAWNLAALGVEAVYALGVLGADWRGDLLRRKLMEAGVHVEPVRVQEDWVTPLFGKVVLMAYGLQQEDARIDFVNTRPLATAAEDDLLARLTALLPQLHALVIADYQLVGVVTERVRAALNELAQHDPRVIFVADSREHIGCFASMVLKPNEIEAARLLFPDRHPDSVTLDDLAAMGARLQDQAGRPVYITLGAQGCLLFEGAAHPVLLPAVPLPPPVDPVGAGDTFLAAIAACLAAGASPQEAGAIATLAAAVTVRKLRVTGTASPAEVLALYDALQLGHPDGGESASPL